MEHNIEETAIDEHFWSKTDENVCDKTLTSTDNDSTMFMEIIPRDDDCGISVTPSPSTQPPSLPIMTQLSPKHIQCVQNLVQPTSPSTLENIYKENEYIQYRTKDFNQEHIESIDKFRNTFTDVSDDFRKYMECAITMNCEKFQESVDCDTAEYEKSITSTLSLMILKMEEEIKIYADKAKKLCEGLISESAEYNIIREEQDAITKLKDEIAKREISLAEKITNKRKMN